MNLFKRISVFLLSVLYLFSTMGTVLSLHYCMGKVIEVRWETFGLPASDSAPASCSSFSPKARSCCKNEYKVVKLGDVHQPAAVHSFLFPALALPSLHSWSVSEPSGGLDQRPSFVAHAPPDESGPPLYLLQRHFRI